MYKTVKYNIMGMRNENRTNNSFCSGKPDISTL